LRFLKDHPDLTWLESPARLWRLSSTFLSFTRIKFYFIPKITQVRPPLICSKLISSCTLPFALYFPQAVLTADRFVVRVLFKFKVRYLRRGSWVKFVISYLTSAMGNPLGNKALTLFFAAIFPTYCSQTQRARWTFRR
jgi:hypothetical protein